LRFSIRFERLQFTLEIGINNRINFLDVTITLDDQKILFDRYEKSTNAGKYINYHSVIAKKKYCLRVD